MKTEIFLAGFIVSSLTFLLAMLMIAAIIIK